MFEMHAVTRQRDRECEPGHGHGGTRGSDNPIPGRPEEEREEQDNRDVKDDEDPACSGRGGDAGHASLVIRVEGMRSLMESKASRFVYSMMTLPLPPLSSMATFRPSARCIWSRASRTLGSMGSLDFSFFSAFSGLSMFCTKLSVWRTDMERARTFCAAFRMDSGDSSASRVRA